MTDKRILTNVAECRQCGDVIESTHRHHMAWCRCGAIAVDGGRSYLRRVANRLDDVIERSTYQE